MGVPVVFTQQSEEDLSEIVAYIAKDDAHRAELFGYELVTKALTLADFPEMGRKVPECRNPKFRELIHGSYRIIYEVLSDPDVVFILRFWHASRGKPEFGRSME
jgi:toxin ParE1/3/4